MINVGDCCESSGIFTRVNYRAGDVTKNKKSKEQRMAGFVPKERSNG
jgi:hypothetical protein